MPLDLGDGKSLSAAAGDVIKTENLLKGRDTVTHDAKSVSERLSIRSEMK